MNTPIQKISSDQLIDKIVITNADALVKISTAFNGAGQMLCHTLQDLARQYSGKVDFFSVDYEADSALSATYRVESVPTLLFFKQGTLVDRLSGLTHRTVITQKIHQLVTV
ncbi:MAG: thioredoxin family protein [Flammeovirgaceae bacterium]|nr:thioredoxin family protein [Flammeovirgaceae bacterium]